MRERYGGWLGSVGGSARGVESWVARQGALARVGKAVGSAAVPGRREASGGVLAYSAAARAWLVGPARGLQHWVARPSKAVGR